jgi:hypothetical protein
MSFPFVGFPTLYWRKIDYVYSFSEEKTSATLYAPSSEKKDY